MSWETVKFLLITVALLAAGRANASQRGTAFVPAPAPASVAAPIADLLFLISAAKATFLPLGRLRLDDVSSNVQFYTTGARTGIMAPSYFFNSTLVAPYVSKQGKWLNAPEAVLYGISGGQYRNVLLSLDSPVYEADTKTVTFTVAVINPSVTALHLSKGAASEVAAEFNSDIGLDSLLTAVGPDTEFAAAALFVDSSKESLAPIAHLKDWSVGSNGWGVSFGGVGVGCTWIFNCQLSWG